MKCLERISGLRNAIKSGKLGPGQMVGTEFAFSQEWGFARNTVRRGIDTLVEEGLLERRPGKGLFVRPPQSATRTVQVVVPNLAWAHQVKFAHGVQAAARDCGAQILIYDAHGQMDLDLDFIRRLPQTSTHGAIIVSLHHRRFSEVLFELKAVDYPFVLVDQRLHDLEVPTVELDNYGGGYMVGKALAQMGHRRVAFLGPLNLQVVNDRLNGFRDAMLDAGVLFDRSLVTNLGGEGLTDWINEIASSAQEAVMPLLSRPDRPSAIFDGSGDIVPFIYQAVRKAGLRIPEDISVVSFDESPFVSFLEPEVARVQLSWTELGKIALDVLLKRMNQTASSRRKNYEHRVMSGEWVASPSLAPFSEPPRDEPSARCRTKE